MLSGQKEEVLISKFFIYKKGTEKKNILVQNVKKEKTKKKKKPNFQYKIYIYREEFSLISLASIITGKRYIHICFNV